MALLSEQLLGNRSIDDISEMVREKVNEYIAGNDLVVGDLVKFKNPRETIPTPQGIYTMSGAGTAPNVPLHAGQFILEETTEYTKVLTNLEKDILILKVYTETGVIETIASAEIGVSDYSQGILTKLDSLRYLYVCYCSTFIKYTVINLNAGYTTITNAALASLLTGQSFSSSNLVPLRATLTSTNKVLISWTNTNYYLTTSLISITGNTATATTPVVNNSEQTFDVALTTVVTDIVFAAYIVTGSYCKYLFYSISGTTVTPSTITQLSAGAYINSTSAGILINKCNSTDNRYVITYKISTGFKMTVGTINTEALTFTSVQATSITKQAGSLNMDVVKIKDDTFVVSYTGYMALIYINSSSVVNVLHFIANNNGLGAYTAVSYRNNTVYNQYAKQLVSLRYSTASASTYNYEMIMNYRNDKILLIGEPIVEKTDMQLPSNFIDVLNSTSMTSTTMITLPLSNNRTITLTPQTNTSTAYSITQYNNGKWSILVEGTYTAVTTLSYFSAWSLSGDRILVSIGTYFYVISIDSANVITVGTVVSNTSTGYVGVTNSQFAYVQLSDSLFMFKYLNTYAQVFALSISGLVITMGASVYANTISPSESFLVKASATTAVVGTRATSSYLCTNVITVTGTTCASGTTTYPLTTAALTYQGFVAEYMENNIFAMAYSRTASNGFYVNRMAVSATVTLNSALYTDSITTYTTQGLVYDSTNKVIMASLSDGVVFLSLPITTASAASTIKISSTSALVQYFFDAAKNRRRNWAVRGNFLLVPAYILSTEAKKMVLYDLKNGLCDRLIADLGDTLVLPSSGFNFHDSVGVLTDGTVFYSHYKYANGAGFRLGCPYIADDVIGVVTNKASAGARVKVKGFGFGNDIYGG